MDQGIHTSIKLEETSPRTINRTINRFFAPYGAMQPCTNKKTANTPRVINDTLNLTEQNVYIAVLIGICMLFSD